MGGYDQNAWRREKERQEKERSKLKWVGPKTMTFGGPLPLEGGRRDDVKKKLEDASAPLLDLKQRYMQKRDKFKKQVDAKGHETAFEKFERKKIEATRPQDMEEKHVEEESTLQGALGFLSLSLAKHKEDAQSVSPEKDEKKKANIPRRKSIWNKRQS